MAVEKPGSAASPDPVTCQSPRGSPGCAFSHAITLVTGGPQTPAAPAGAAPEMNPVVADTSSATASARKTAERPRPVATIHSHDVGSRIALPIAGWWTPTDPRHRGARSMSAPEELLERGSY